MFIFLLGLIQISHKINDLISLQIVGIALYGGPILRQHEFTRHEAFPWQDRSDSVKHLPWHYDIWGSGRA